MENLVVYDFNNCETLGLAGDASSIFIGEQELQVGDVVNVFDSEFEDYLGVGIVVKKHGEYVIKFKKTEILPEGFVITLAYKHYGLPLGLDIEKTGLRIQEENKIKFLIHLNNGTQLKLTKDEAEDLKMQLNRY